MFCFNLIFDLYVVFKEICHIDDSCLTYGTTQGGGREGGGGACAYVCICLIAFPFCAPGSKDICPSLISNVKHNEGLRSVFSSVLRGHTCCTPPTCLLTRDASFVHVQLCDGLSFVLLYLLLMCQWINTVYVWTRPLMLVLVLQKDLGILKMVCFLGGEGMEGGGGCVFVWLCMDLTEPFAYSVVFSWCNAETFGRLPLCSMLASLQFCKISCLDWERKLLQFTNSAPLPPPHPPLPTKAESPPLKHHSQQTWFDAAFPYECTFVVESVATRPLLLEHSGCLIYFYTKKKNKRTASSALLP